MRINKNSSAKDGRLYHLDLAHNGMNMIHHNVYNGIEKVKGLHVENHSTGGAKALGDTITVFKYAGRAYFAVAAVAFAYEIYRAEDKAREVTRQVSGWVAASAGALYGAKAGTYVGASIGSGAAGAGAIPGSVVGGFMGGLIGGAVGWWVGTGVSEVLYDWVFTPLEKEEYHLVCVE